jgi:hypothetical protein
MHFVSEDLVLTSGLLDADWSGFHGLYFRE